MAELGVDWRPNIAAEQKRNRDWKRDGRLGDVSVKGVENYKEIPEEDWWK